MRLKLQFLNKKRVYLITIGLLLTFFLILLFSFLTERYTIAYAQPQHKCFPQRLWLIDKKYRKVTDFNYDDFVAFRGKNIPYMKDGIRWVKKVIGKVGDRIEVQLSEKKVFKTILINDMPMKKEVIGQVILTNKQPQKYVLDVFKTDTKNRPLPVISPTVIGSNQIFVYSPHDRSYDSRYWGLVNEDQIIGKAYPIF